MAKARTASDSRNAIPPPKWDAFISHASEDKAEVADPLYEALTKRGLRVWYDKAEIKIGDGLRKKIDEGLSQSRYGIVILSEHFFEKDWPQAELDGLASLEVDGRKVILPVWHGLTVRDVRERSPLLAGRLAARTEEGIGAVVDMLLTEITGEVSEPAPSLREAEPGIGASGLASARALRSNIRNLRQRDVNRQFGELVDQLSTALSALPVTSQNNSDLLKSATDLEPIMATLLSLLCELVESDPDALSSHVRTIYAVSDDRAATSGITTWLEVPSWVMWWLQTAFASYLVWRENWGGIRMLTEQAWADTGGEYQPSTSLGPTQAGQSIARLRYPNDFQRYGDLMPILDLARTLRNVGYLKGEQPGFVDSDDYPFRPIAVAMFLISLTCVQRQLPNKVRAWQHMGAYVLRFVRRLEVDVTLQHRLAHDLFQVDIETFRMSFNDWVKPALGSGWVFPGGPWSGPLADFARLKA